MLTAARPVAARFLFSQSSVNRAAVKPNTLFRTMGTIADGVEFDTIAREWRCKVRVSYASMCRFFGVESTAGGGEQRVMRSPEAYVNED